MPRAALHRQNLIRTAMRLFRRQGYASVGLQEVLKESGAPKGSLYHYFPQGKEALGEAAVELAGELIATMLTDLATQHKNPTAFVKAYCTQMSEWMEESDFRSGCPIATTVLETTPASAPISAAGSNAVASWIAIIAGVYIRAGLGKARAEQQAELVISAIEGSLILSRLSQSRRPIMNIAKAVSAGQLGANTSNA